MLHLRVFGAGPVMEEVATSVSALPGADHITRTDAGDRSGRSLVTADVDPEAADAALHALSRIGVPAEDVWLLRLEGLQPGPASRRRDGGAVVWADLLGQAAEHARLVWRYLVLMAVAGVIAAYGVIYSNGILVVGAMAVSPDFLPIAATCIGLVARRRSLVGRAFGTLAAGLGITGLVAGVLTALLDLVNLLPSSFEVGESALRGLTTINSSTVVVAFAAGVAGILALETRASAAVGVAISVTTIPASAYLGVAAGVGEIGKASGALAVLGINVAMLLIGGSLTLVVQRSLARSAGGRDQVAAR
jgi:uncharacterized hydrophobic protein (TIGR00271 family)